MQAAAMRTELRPQETGWAWQSFVIPVPGREVETGFLEIRLYRLAVSEGPWFNQETTP